MKKPAATTILYALAISLAAAALWLSAHNLANIPVRLAQLVRRHGDVLQLEGLVSKSEADRAAFAAVAATTNQPPDPEGWIRLRLPGVELEVHDRETVALRPGWTVRRVDVLLPDIELATLGQLLASAEGLRPPWRTVECQITAREGVPGRGRVALVWEGLFRAESRTNS